MLLLNPDTIIQEDTLLKCLKYADGRPQLGGLGVPMVDGAGRYLPESKRHPYAERSVLENIGALSFGSPVGKIQSLLFGQLAADASQPIEILSRAYMWMRKKALDEVGLLDENYFMYGEDIDLSWRLMKGGYENHYFADTSIVHYKGESTKKGSLNYVLVFYKAMQIFARTHFSGPGGRAMHAVIQIAIYLRAAMAIASRAWKTLRCLWLSGVCCGEVCWVFSRNMGNGRASSTIGIGHFRPRPCMHSCGFWPSRAREDTTGPGGQAAWPRAWQGH